MKNRILSFSLAVVLALSAGVIGCKGEEVPGITEYALSISSTDGGSTTVPEAGCTCGEGTESSGGLTVPQDCICAEGTEVSIEATPDPGHRFIGWTGDVDTIANVKAASTTITMNDDYLIIANFVRQYSLTLSSTTGGEVTAPGEGVFTYDEGEVVNLVAKAKEGYHFVNWTGDVGTIVDVNVASTTVRMSGDYSTTATFEPYEVEEYPTIYVPSTIKVMMDDGSVEIMDLNEYVKGVIAAEMGSGWPIEALKAQAVAARTFAVNNTHHDHSYVDVCTDHNCCQAWKGPPYEATLVDAVTSTYNEVITYNGTIIREALYFSHCSGHTRNSEDYGGWDYVPYLRGVSCGCADEYGWTDYGGHGVGMCQYGAKVMAKQGFSYVDILGHYYGGVAIAPANTG